MSEMRINSGGSRERRLTEELAAKDAEIERLVRVLTKISTAARRDTSLVPPDPLLEFIVAQVDDALAETGKK
jgi:hypothetical protein